MLALLSVFAPFSAAQPKDDQPRELPALQVVVLVDESGSLSADDVRAEQEAARTIAFSSTLSEGSEVTVAGFASADAVGQRAVDVVCPTTVVSSGQDRDVLAECIGKLHRRTSAEGDGTDHASALAQALEVVRSGKPEKKIVFLLTDGKLDVAKSTNYQGSSPEQRNAAGEAEATRKLGELEAAGAQVWPMGFGEIDQNALAGFARGASCADRAPDPHEQIARSQEELVQAVATAISSASCVDVAPPDVDSLPQGGTVDLHVTIPEFASDAAILVYKKDARVQVDYLAPGEDKPAPDAGGAEFEFAGQATETETLQITDPVPGEWTVRLSAADVPTHDVAATVAYQASVRANMTVSPPTPVAGQQVEVDMQVWARGRPVTDREALGRLTFVTTLEGDGITGDRVELSDEDGDGTFSAGLTVPATATGGLTFTGTVSGVGIGGDTRVLPTGVQESGAAIVGQILFDTNETEVVPGGEMTGRVAIENESGKPTTVRLVLDDQSSGARLTLDPVAHDVSTGTTEIPFTIRFAENTTLGSTAATMRVVDDADEQLVIAQRQLSTNVAPEPTIVEKLFWLWVVLAVLLLAALGYLLVRLRARRDAFRVRGLKIQLLHGGLPGQVLEPRDPAGTVFSFQVLEDFAGFQLQHANRGAAEAYALRRDRAGLELTAPGRSPVPFAPGKRHEVGPDLALTVTDDRHTAPTDNVRTDTDAFNPFGATPFRGAPVGGGPFNTPPVGAPDPMATDSFADPFGTPAPNGDTNTDPNNPFR